MKIKLFAASGLLLLAACGTQKKTPATTPPVNTTTKTEQPAEKAKEPEKSEEKKSKHDSYSEITISLVGDLMTHLPQTQNAKTSTGTYDFNPSFEYIKPYLSDADITIGNLETTLAGTSKPYAGYPAFNAPDEFVTAIKNAGVDFLVTSNNHSMDTDEQGLLRTIDVIEKNGLGYTGTHRSQKDRDSVRILNIKDTRFAILNYTYGTNGKLPSAQHKYMLNLIDTALMLKDITSAKAKGAEIVLVYFHYGQENVAEPNAEQKKAVNKAIDYGADLVIGAHPHVVGPVDYFKTINATLDTGFVAYSLGNFISNQYWRYTDAGVIVTVTLQKNTANNKISIKKTEYLPTWVYRATNPQRKAHTVLPAGLSATGVLPDFIDASSKEKMREAFDDTKKIILKYTPKPFLQELKR